MIESEDVEENAPHAEREKKATAGEEVGERVGRPCEGIRGAVEGEGDVRFHRGNVECPDKGGEICF